MEEAAVGKGRNRAGDTGPWGPGAPLRPPVPADSSRLFFLAFHNFWLQEFPPQKAPKDYFLRPNFYAEFK